MIYLIYSILLLLLFVAILLLAPTSVVLKVTRPDPTAPLRLFAAWTLFAKTLGAIYEQKGPAKRVSLLVFGFPWTFKRSVDTKEAPSSPAKKVPGAAPQSRTSPPAEKPTPQPAASAPRSHPPAQPAKGRPKTESPAAKKTTPPAPPKKPAISEDQTPPPSKQAKWSKAEILDLARGPGWLLFKRLYRTVALRDLRVRGWFGLENPAHTGQLLAAAQLFAVLGFDRIRLELSPAFDRIGLGGAIRLRGRLHLGHLLFSLLCFIVQIAWRRLQSRRLRRAGAQTAQ